MKNSFAVIGILVLVITLIVGGTFGYIALYKKAAPEMAEAERNVYENTPSYVQGKTQEIAKYKREYETAKDENDKKALREVILTSASTVDRTKLPANLQAFLRDLENQR